MSHISIDADVMRQHAARIEQLSADAAEAAAALRSVPLGGGAFGLLCAWIVPPISVVAGAVSAHINGAEDILERTGEELRGAVSDFETFEDTVVQAVRSIEGQLG